MTAETSPIVVGGVGGSGTRVVADLLRRAGVFLGGDLNRALDYLGSTLLFKRPRWLSDVEQRCPAEIDDALDLLAKALTRCHAWSPSECARLFAAAAAMAEHGHDHAGSGRGEWPFVRMARMIDDRRPVAAAGQPWGWKEPNSHVLLPHLAAHFADLRFVLVLRHGLDMAFSANQTQLRIWGHRFGVVDDGKVPLPHLLLRYWIAANETAIETGRTLLGERFIVVRYDDLCRTPDTEIPLLLAGLGLSADFDAPALETSPSTGRYREHDLSVFGVDELSAVERLGFTTT